MRAHTDMGLIALTFTLTIAYSIEVGVLVSFVISLLMIVRRSSKVSIGIMVRFTSVSTIRLLYRVDRVESKERISGPL